MRRIMVKRKLFLTLIFFIFTSTFLFLTPVNAYAQESIDPEVSTLLNRLQPNYPIDGVIRNTMIQNNSGTWSTSKLQKETFSIYFSTSKIGRLAGTISAVCSPSPMPQDSKLTLGQLSEALKEADSANDIYFEQNMFRTETMIDD